MAEVQAPETPSKSISKTPRKTENIFFSPSGNYYCICCQKVTPVKRRICLWKDGKLSSNGEIVDFVIKDLAQKTDFQVICELCLKKFRSHEAKRNELLVKVRNGRKINRKFKRGFKSSASSSSTPSTSSSPLVLHNNERRKKLFKEEEFSTKDSSKEVETAMSTSEDLVAEVCDIRCDIGVLSHDLLPYK